MKTNPTIIAARKGEDGIQPGRAGSPLPAAEGYQMSALPASSRRRARSDAPYLRPDSLRSLRSFAAIAISLWLAGAGANAQVNSGSNGSDGAFNPTTNTVINMADHPDGIYHYTSVNIPGGVTVSFIPNANNTPVVWLVQSNCTITGILSVNGRTSTNSIFGANGGPGGWRGGNGAVTQGSLPESGFGPGGGKVGTDPTWNGGNASHASLGDRNTTLVSTNQPYTHYEYPQHLPGDIYGNPYELPLLGGSGGSGGRDARGGGGGGGAILIAASGTLNIAGTISARGGNAYFNWRDNNGNTWQDGTGGAGSGGGIRAVASNLTGSGLLDTGGGSAVHGLQCGFYSCGSHYNVAGIGRIRLEALSDTFTGSTAGSTTRGFTGVILLATNQPRIIISSVGGQPISSNPTGLTTTPDAFLSSQQPNPVSIVVNCFNVPLNSDIVVEVKPASGPYVSAVGRNTSGTVASSTATVLLTVPRGGGTIQAKVASGN